MITETQIEEYFRTKVEEFRARGVRAYCINAQFHTGMQPQRLHWALHADPDYCVISHKTADSAFDAIRAEMGNPATKAAELRAQAEQLLKSADELDGKQ